MRLNINIDVDNDAFHNTGGGLDPAAEVGRILPAVSEGLNRGQSSGLLRDSNGNTVGAWTLQPDGTER